MTDPSQVINELKRCLRNVSANADQQISYLGSLGQISVDELALELDEAERMLWLPKNHGEISREQIEAVQSLGEALQQLAQTKPSIWTEQGLREAAEWNPIRQKAAEALGLFSG